MRQKAAEYVKAAGHAAERQVGPHLKKSSLYVAGFLFISLLRLYNTWDKYIEVSVTGTRTNEKEIPLDGIGRVEKGQTITYTQWERRWAVTHDPLQFYLLLGTIALATAMAVSYSYMARKWHKTQHEALQAIHTAFTRQNRILPLTGRRRLVIPLPGFDYNVSPLAFLSLKNQNLSTIFIDARIDADMEKTDVHRALFLYSFWKGRQDNAGQPITRDLLRRLGASNADSAITTVDELCTLLEEARLPLKVLKHWLDDVTRFQQEMNTPAFLAANPHLNNPQTAKDITETCTLLHEAIRKQELEPLRQRAAAYMFANLQRINPAEQQGGFIGGDNLRDPHMAMQNLSKLPPELQCHVLSFVHGNYAHPNEDLITAQHHLPHEHFIDVPRGRITFEKQPNKTFKPVRLNGEKLPEDWRQKVAAKAASLEAGASKKTV